MLAERLCFIAEDILNDLLKSNIINLLNSAVNLSASRANINDQQYAKSAQALRTQASEIKANSQIIKYPKEIRDLIFSSNYAYATPEMLTNVVINGLSTSKTLGITSAEFQVYVQNVGQLINELQANSNAGKAFHLRPLTVPDGKISLDVLIPRGAVANETSALFKVLLRFSNAMATLSELVNSEPEVPVLTYASTTDPVIGFSVLLASGTAILAFYKELLDVAEKQLNLLKTIREFRKSGLPEATAVEKSLSDMIDQGFDQAVKNTVARLEHKVDEPRVAELTVALKKDGKVMLDAITDGAKISITIETLDRVAQLPPLKGVTVDQHQALAERIAVEGRIEQALTDIGRPGPALLTHLDTEAEQSS